MKKKGILSSIFNSKPIVTDDTDFNDLMEKALEKEEEKPEVIHYEVPVENLFLEEAVIETKEEEVIQSTFPKITKFGTVVPNSMSS